MAIATRLSQQVAVVPSRRFMRNLTAVTHSAAMIPSDRIILVAYGGGEGERVRLRRMCVCVCGLSGNCVSARRPHAHARKSLYATVNCDAPCPKCLGLEWLQLGGILALIFYWEWRNFNCKLQISIDTRGCGSVPSLIRPSRTLSH